MTRKAMNMVLALGSKGGAYRLIQDLFGDFGILLMEGYSPQNKESTVYGAM